MTAISKTPSRHVRGLLLAGLVCSNLLVLLLTGYSLNQSHDKYEKRAEALTQTVASALNQNLSHSVDKIDLALRTVADELERQLAAGGIDDAAMSRFMNRQKQRLPEVEAFRVANAEGYVILGDGVDKQARVTWADRDYFIYHREHNDRLLHIAKPVFGRVAQKYIVGFAQRYNYPDGRFAGVISAPIAISHFDEILSRHALGANGTIVLRDAALGLISRWPAISDQPAGKIGNTILSAQARTLLDSGVHQATFHTSNSADGFERTITFSRLDKAPMIAIVGVDRSHFFENWHAEVFNTSALALGFMANSLT